MRFSILLIACLFAMPLSAQGIHRATPIDLEQDQRLDNLESELDSLTKSIETLAKAVSGKAETLVAKSVLDEAPKPIEDPVPNGEEPRYCLGDTKYCEGKLHYLACVNGEEKWLPVPMSQSVQSSVTYSEPVVTYSQPVVTQSSVTYSQPVVQRSVSSRYSIGELRALIQQHRPGGWRGAVYGDVRPQSYAWRHLQGEHGFSSDQVSGLSQSEALILHDLAHGGKVSPHRSATSPGFQSVVTYPSVDYSQPVYQEPIYSQPQRATPVRTVIQAAAIGCANGRCPTQPSRQGWSLFGGWR